MQRIVVLGRGGAGKTTAAHRLGYVLGAPVVELDLGFPRCAWRALRRSRERADLWWWLLTWRRRSLVAAVRTHAPDADLHVITSPRALTAFVCSAAGRHLGS